MPLPAAPLRTILLTSAVAALIWLNLCLPGQLSTNDHPVLPIHFSGSRPSDPPEPHGLSLPGDYNAPNTDPEWCESKYSTAYLTNLRDGRQSYCNPSVSDSSLNCFNTKITDERTDTFCIAKGVSMLHSHQSTTFRLNCTTWESLGTDGSTALAPLKTESFPKYLYNTGPYHIWSDYFSTVPGLPSQPFCSERQGTPKYTILVKRDGDGNMWHSLLEIFSLYLTLDTLRITPLDPSAHTPEPFLSAADMSSAQIVILDDYPDGPFFDLWKAIAPLPVVRLKDIPSYGTAAACLDNVIIPLAGGSNPLWRGDWHTGSCTHSQLIDTFTRRVLSHYGHGAANSTSLLPPSSSDTPRPKDDDTTTTTDLTLTFIDRRTTRALVDAPQHLANLRLHFPHIHIQALDFAALPFAEQLRVIQTTDVLVGVHGAGLTHALFLPPGASVVEIQPRRLNYKGFRNLAKMRGHRYFSAHAAANDSAPDWHDLDVSVGEDEFLELVGAAVRAVLHRGAREEDVVVGG